MCEILEEMKKEVADKTRVITYIETCREFGISDSKELIQRVLEKYSFLTEAQAQRYVQGL